MHTSFSSIFGSLLLHVSLVFAFISIACSLAGVRLKSPKLIQSAYFSNHFTFGLLSMASLVMLYALVSHDFSIAYVEQSVDTSMSWFYKLAAFWGGLDGSLLFWAWLLSLFSFIAIRQNRYRHADLLPYVNSILMIILIFFLIILVAHKQPFTPFLPYKPLNGQGINPLLRDFYMTIHPPSLYIGYVSASVPFAFGMAALITGNLDNAWLKSVRKWMILCWYFLSQGLFLGALWAYHVLNWGGFWGWDPVENAGLLPWFTATAFLHSTIIQERLGMMKLWNLVLVVVTFLLTIIGTFLTRSGVVESQHAFGKDSALAISFLIFIGLIIVTSTALLVYRLHILRSRSYISSWLSREFTFLLNNWILLGSAFFVLIATLFPILSKWLTNETISVGAPFYNRWMGPIGIVLLFLAALSPLFSWKKSPIKWLKGQLRFPFLIGVLLTGLIYWRVPWTRASSYVFTENLKFPTGIVCILISFIAILGIIQEFYVAMSTRQKLQKESVLKALFTIIQKNQRRYGGYLVHIGISLMFIGFAGQSYKKEKEVKVLLHQEASFERYKIRYDDIQTSQDEEKSITTVTLSVFESSTSQLLFILKPAKWTYFGRESEPRTIVGRQSIFAEELYIFFHSASQDPLSNEPSLNLQMTTNPLIHWLWFGFVWLLLGTIVAFLPLNRGLNHHPLVIIIALLFLSSQPSILQAKLPDNLSNHQDQSTQITPPQNERETRLFKKIACLCGGCARLPLGDCTCSHAAQERIRITKLINLGHTDDQIYNDFEIRYPKQAVLIVSRHWAVTWIYLIPMGFFIGMAWLIYKTSLKKNQKSFDVDPNNPSYLSDFSRYEKHLKQDLDSQKETP